MDIKVSARRPSQAKSDLTVLLVHSDETWCAADDDSVAAVIGDYRKAVDRKVVRDPLIWGAPALGKGPVQRYWMMAPERIDHFALGEQIKTAAARAYNYACSMRYKNLTLLLNAPQGAQWSHVVAEGLYLGAYRFDKYRSRHKTEPPDMKVEILVGKDDLEVAQDVVGRARVICDAVNYARDLANEPGASVYPEILAEEARRLAKLPGLTAEVLDEKQLRRQGYNGLLAVGRGSHHAPRLIVVRYKPRRPASNAHLTLIGKGITFDTGGICLKPAKDMWRMKGDMSGAAAVLATMRAVAALRPTLRITAIVPTAHNAIGPEAIHPGDVIHARNGKTIEVENTDAEGRIILTDALARAGEEGATHIIDVATLTGACHRALGHALAGLFSEDLDLRDRIMAAGGVVGEGFWPLPLLDEYRDLIRSRIADINNMSSSPNGGAITAALFLREFVPSGVAWAHLDIAGTAILDKEWKYFRKGATGSATRTLIQLCMEEW